jgi:hypothetical protein
MKDLINLWTKSCCRFAADDDLSITNPIYRFGRASRLEPAIHTFIP